jgi:hypothetical protein
MNTSTEHFRVLNVYQTVRDPRSHARIECGQKPALCFKGRKHMVCVIVGYPVRVVKRPAADFTSSKCKPPLYKGEAYPVARAVRVMSAIAARNGITKGAQLILDRAAGEATADLDEDLFENEEETTMTKTQENPNPVDGEEGEAAGSEASETGASEPEPVKPARTRKPKKEAAAATTETATATEETANVAAKKTTKAKKAKAAKTPKGPSRISQAVEFMREDIKKGGGMKALERGDRKALFEKAAKKFGLSTITCSIQYNKQVRNKAK